MSITSSIHENIIKFFPKLLDLLMALDFFCNTVRTGLEGPGLTVAQKIWYCVATVGGQYMWTRIQSFSAFRRWGDSEQVLVFRKSPPLPRGQPSSFGCLLRLTLYFVQRSLARRAWLLIQRIEGIYKAAAFGNLLIFLYTGRYGFQHSICFLLNRLFHSNSLKELFVHNSC